MKITDYPNRIPEIYGTFVFLWIEGIFSGFIMTFILINYLKTDRV